MSLRSWWRKLNADVPCDRCGVVGGTRWVKGEKVEGRIVKRLLCSECKTSVFFYPWREDREWVSW